MAEFTQTIDDEVALLVDTRSGFEPDQLKQEIIHSRYIDDEIVFAEHGVGELVQLGPFGDEVAVIDDLFIGDLHQVALGDEVVVADGLFIPRSVLLGDIVSTVDALSSQATIQFGIADARALTEVKVRIDFEVPTLINAALTNTANYRFKNLSSGSVEVVPVSVGLPPGQPNPFYVEVVTTEHTEGATYEVALTEAIRGAAGEVGHVAPVSYVGIGVAPTLHLVIARSSTEVEVHFSEPIIDNASARNPRNYLWAGGIVTIDVRSVEGSVVVLQTTGQVPGHLYTLTVLGPVPGQSYDTEFFDDLDAGDMLEESVEVGPMPGEVFDVEASDEVDGVDGLAVLIMSTLHSRSTVDAIAAVDGVAAQLAGPPVLRAILGAISAPMEVQVSSDGGVTWTRKYFPPAGTMRNGDRNPTTGVVIFVGDAGVVFRSADNGETWAQSTPFGTTEDNGACWYGNGVWVVNHYIYSNLTLPNVHYSTNDGLSWSSAINPDSGTGTGPTGGAPAGASDIWYDGCYAPALGLHIGVGIRGSIWTSPNGSVWTRRTAANNYIGASAGFRSVAWSEAQHQFVAVGDGLECQTSPDGVTWTRRPMSAIDLMEPWAVCYSPALNLWLAVGEGESGQSRIQTSPDGVTWTSRTPAAGEKSLLGCAWDSRAGNFIAVGHAYGLVMTSPDGIAWTRRVADNAGGNFTNNADSSILVVIGGEAVPTQGDDEMNWAGIATSNATVAANARQGYNTTGGAFTLTAPASPSNGAHFAIVETAGSLTPLTVNGNGKLVWNPFTKSFVASFAIGVAGVSLHWIYNGTAWSLV